MPGATVAFPTFSIPASINPGQAWGGARISGDGTPQFQVNGGAWVEQAIVKSSDQITVRLTAPATGSRTATFILRSGQTTGTNDGYADGGFESTTMQETTASFTAYGQEDGACGSASGPASATQPSGSLLCATGAGTSVTGSSGQWRWDCNGRGGGSSTAGNACSAPYASQTLSISANSTSMMVGATSTITASSTAAGLLVTLTPSGACSLSGTTATGTAAGTCTITASQPGTGDNGTSRYLPATNAAADITVTPAPPVNGACGTANGGVSASAPAAANLCSTGDATAVMGTGPWSWTCTGRHGGSDSAICTANPRYTKVSHSGTALQPSITLGNESNDWACTQDNASGKIWEVKTTSGLRSQDNTYSWYDTNPATNGGSNGTANGGICANTGRCDTEKYAEDVNAAGLCGATDWRMPSKDELLDIVEPAQINGARINPEFFPNTPVSTFWSGSPYAGNPNYAYAWNVPFGLGSVTYYSSIFKFRVRLVRAGHSLAPVLSGLAVSRTTQNGATVQSTSSLAGTGYWLVQPSSSTNPAPTPAQLKAGGQGTSMSANTLTDFPVIGLTPGTTYDFYLVAHDPVSGQLSAPVQKVRFTTTAAPGVCGSAHNTAATPLLTSAPTANLCSPDATVAVTDGISTWTWTCPGNLVAHCQAPRGYTVSTSAGANGSIGAAQTVAYGSMASITVTPATSYVVDAVTSTCGGSLSGSSYTTGLIQGDCTVSATFKAASPPPPPPGPDPVNGQCGGSHGGLFTSAPTANLCSAGSASTVSGTGPWSWSCSGHYGGSNASCSANIRSYLVTATTGEGGRVSPAQRSVDHGKSISFSVQADSAYRIDSVSGCGGTLSGTTYTTGAVAANCTVSAGFALIAHAITATAQPNAGGIVTCSPNSVGEGGSATCTVTASASYRFAGWTGACAGQGATCTLANVMAAQASVAQFTQSTLTVPEGPQMGQPLNAAPQPSNGWQLMQASTQASTSLGAALPPGVTLPHGVVSLRLELGTQGSEATVVLTYPQNLPAGAVYYKYGSTRDNPRPHWYAFPGAHIDGRTVTLTLKDGGAGDDDLAENGVISDPGGVALVGAPLAAAAIPALGEWALALMAMAVVLLSLGTLRRRG